MCENQQRRKNWDAIDKHESCRWAKSLVKQKRSLRRIGIKACAYANFHFTCNLVKVAKSEITQTKVNMWYKIER